jgi:hypothetical protein
VMADSTDITNSLASDEDYYSASLHQLSWWAAHKAH